MQVKESVAFWLVTDQHGQVEMLTCQAGFKRPVVAFAELCRLVRRKGHKLKGHYFRIAAKDVHVGSISGCRRDSVVIWLTELRIIYGCLHLDLVF